MRSQEKTIRILQKSLLRAEQKHPKFANYATSKSKAFIDSWCDEIKKTNDKAEEVGNTPIENIAMEELVEFLQAVKNKDNKSAYQEAIDLAVVALRMAEWAMCEM